MGWLSEYGRTAGVGLLVLALVVFGGWQFFAATQGQAQTATPAEEGPRTTPPLDLLAPTRIKTATFALG